MEKMDIEIPADAKTVTLELKKQCGFTLRSLLPRVGGEVELVVEDAFKVNRFGVSEDADLYRLHAASGDSLLHKLVRSRVVEGEALLDLTPSLKMVEPHTSLINGTFATLTGSGYIELWVRPPVPDEED